MRFYFSSSVLKSAGLRRHKWSGKRIYNSSHKGMDGHCGWQFFKTKKKVNWHMTWNISYVIHSLVKSPLKTARWQTLKGDWANRPSITFRWTKSRQRLMATTQDSSFCIIRRAQLNSCQNQTGIKHDVVSQEKPPAPVSLFFPPLMWKPRSALTRNMTTATAAVAKLLPLVSI